MGASASMGASMGASANVVKAPVLSRNEDELIWVKGS